jgi:allophanate hydrolase
MTPTEQIHAAIAADAAHNDPALWIHRVPDADLLAQAAQLEAEGRQDRPLWGTPVAVKDNIDVAGLPTTAACPAYAYTPAEDATAVARLRAAGAIVMGKTNLDQFATGLVGVRSPYGVPRAPFDPLRVPGGSSSGSGAAVSAGIVPIALGTDTAGSGRVPAMFGNVVGLKPTVGAVPSAGMVPACRSIDTISVFARTVDEALAVARIIAGFHRPDPYSRRPPAGYLRTTAIAPLRVAIPDDLSPCDAPIRVIIETLAAAHRAQATDIAGFLALARLLYDGPWVAERTAALRPMLEHPETLHPTTCKILQGGLERLTVDAFDAFHVQAQMRRQAEILFEAVDVLMLPTAPCWPSLAELEADPIGPNSRLGTYTNFVNLCDLAAIAVPAGFTPAGHPVGVTLIGPAWSEGRLAALADAIHRSATTRVGATDSPLPPAAPPAMLEPGETALFCIGAHMAGLPLNHQVTSLGGRFLRAAKTIPAYRFYALGNRPGLVLGGSGAIEGEVWALPTSAIGALLAQVPSPLGFGTVNLEDGPCLGFLAEAEATTDAPEITHLGGWRAYLKNR